MSDRDISDALSDIATQMRVANLMDYLREQRYMTDLTGWPAEQRSDYLKIHARIDAAVKEALNIGPSS